MAFNSFTYIKISCNTNSWNYCETFVLTASVNSKCLSIINKNKQKYWINWLYRTLVHKGTLCEVNSVFLRLAEQGQYFSADFVCSFPLILNTSGKLHCHPAVNHPGWSKTNKKATKQRQHLISALYSSRYWHCWNIFFNPKLLLRLALAVVFLALL